jgi:hypothetical protein
LPGRINDDLDLHRALFEGWEVEAMTSAGTCDEIGEGAERFVSWSFDAADRRAQKRKGQDMKG